MNMSPFLLIIIATAVLEFSASAQVDIGNPVPLPNTADLINARIDELDSPILEQFRNQLLLFSSNGLGEPRCDVFVKTNFKPVGSYNFDNLPEYMDAISLRGNVDALLMFGTSGTLYRRCRASRAIDTVRTEGIDVILKVEFLRDADASYLILFKAVKTEVEFWKSTKGQGISSSAG